jgi:hypothetical protein
MRAEQENESGLFGPFFFAPSTYVRGAETTDYVSQR